MVLMMLVYRCVNSFRLGLLERESNSSTVPDLYAVAQGIGVWLNHQHRSQFEVS